MEKPRLRLGVQIEIRKQYREGERWRYVLR